MLAGACCIWCFQSVDFLLLFGVLEVQAQMSALVEQNHTLEQRNRLLMDSLQQSQVTKIYIYM